MQRYSVIHVPVLSFFSRELYRDVCAHWKGTGFAYLLLLLAVCWIPPIVNMHVALSRFIDNDAAEIVSQVPRMAILDGEASIDAPQPYYIKDPKSGRVLVAIDTTGTLTSLADTDAQGLVTRTEAVFKKNEIETRTFSFKDVRAFTLDQDRIKYWLDTARKFVAVTVYPFALLVSFAARIVQVLIYAAIGLLFASWCRSKRTYLELVRLSVVAVTPVIIARTVLGMVQLSVPVAGLWYFLASMGYLLFGVKAAAAEADANGESSPTHVPRDA